MATVFVLVLSTVFRSMTIKARELREKERGRPENGCQKLSSKQYLNSFLVSVFSLLKNRPPLHPPLLPLCTCVCKVGTHSAKNPSGTRPFPIINFELLPTAKITTKKRKKKVYSFNHQEIDGFFTNIGWPIMGSLRHTHTIGLFRHHR